MHHKLYIYIYIFIYVCVCVFYIRSLAVTLLADGFICKLCKLCKLCRGRMH